MSIREPAIGEVAQECIHLGLRMGRGKSDPQPGRARRDGGRPDRPDQQPTLPQPCAQRQRATVPLTLLIDFALLAFAFTVFIPM